jgi:3-oxoacyl-[acyl-carrier protein] reductase
MQSKTAVVTGGLGGIGQAIVRVLAARGDRVIVFDCLPSTDPRVQALEAQGVPYVSVDLASVESIKNGFAQVPTLDILINNAGITRDMLALRMSEQEWDAVLNVNLKGAFFCAQQALKRMIKNKKSYIVSISSIVGIHGNPGQINYAASKAGLIAMTKTLAAEYASRNVMVNAVAPGFIDTSMTSKLSDDIKQKALSLIPLQRFGSPDDVAQAVAFLSSGSADYITGQVIEITGGM